MARSKSFPKSLLVLLIGFGLFVISLPFIFWFRLDYYEVCPICARKQDVQKWLVPFTRTAYYTYAQLQETTLSATLDELKLVEPHEHLWLIAHGEGPGPQVIFGEGFPISQGLTTPCMGPFVRLLNRHTDEATVGFWFARITRPEYSYAVRNVADKCVGKTYESDEAFQTYLTQVGTLELSQQRFRIGRIIDEPQTRTPPRLLYQRPSR